MKNHLFHIHIYTLLLFTGFACTDNQLIDLTPSSENFHQAGAPDEFWQGEINQNAQLPIKDFEDFLEMVESIKRMDVDELMNIPEDEIIKLGKPVINITENTVLLSEQALRRLHNPLGDLSKYVMTLTELEHEQLTREVFEIKTPIAGFNSARRNLSADQLRKVLIEINEAEPEEGASCEILFNKTGEFVVLYPKDNFAVANLVCPQGTHFILMPGVHQAQRVFYSKEGNRWIGLQGAIMDGLNVNISAFDGNYQDHVFALFMIRNYRDFGIVDRNGESNSLVIRKMVFINIGPFRNGQEYGAIKILWSENIEVRECYFENVTSAIRFMYSRGPLKVMHNDALNPGRNFFQCDKCSGSEIEVIDNSMEYYERFGTNLMEDFINIFASEGLANSPIKVNYNRARTNGQNLSPSGSFIILGDFGGKHQEAKHNIGVNPGQVGIGAASGNHILVESNMMFSDLIEGISNVAFYSWKNPPDAPDCSDHRFLDNIANWTCGIPGVCNYGELNRAWSAGNCGLDNEEILLHTHDNLTLGPEIWYQLPTRN